MAYEKVINYVPSGRDNPYFQVTCKLFVELKKIGVFLQNYLKMHILHDASCPPAPWSLPESQQRFWC